MLNPIDTGKTVPGATTPSRPGSPRSTDNESQASRSTLNVSGDWAGVCCSPQNRDKRHVHDLIANPHD